MFTRSCVFPHLLIGALWVGARAMSQYLKEGGNFYEMICVMVEVNREENACFEHSPVSFHSPLPAEGWSQTPGLQRRWKLHSQFIDPYAGGLLRTALPPGGRVILLWIVVMANKAPAFPSALCVLQESGMGSDTLVSSTILPLWPPVWLWAYDCHVSASSPVKWWL